MALKPLFSSLYYCSELGGPEASRGVTPSMVFPTHGYRGVTLLMTCLTTPYLGDALILATPCLGDALCSCSVDFLLWTLRVVPPYVDLGPDVDFDFDSGRRPGTGRYSIQTFDNAFWMHLCNSPPRLLKNHDFTFSPILLPMHKKPIHPTWLSKNPTKINSFSNQTFHTSFCIHLRHFPTLIAQKP